MTSGIAITSIANAALTWEETAVTNVGLDFGFFDNKLHGNIDVYNKLTTGILYTPDMYMVMGNAMLRKRILRKLRIGVLNWSSDGEIISAGISAIALKVSFLLIKILSANIKVNWKKDGIRDIRNILLI